MLSSTQTKCDKTQLARYSIKCLKQTKDKPQQHQGDNQQQTCDVHSSTNQQPLTVERNKQQAATNRKSEVAGELPGSETKQSHNFTIHGDKEVPWCMGYNLKMQVDEKQEAEERNNKPNKNKQATATGWQ